MHSLVAMARPFGAQVNYRYHHGAVIGLGEHNAYALAIVRGAFQRKLWVGLAVRFAMRIIDRAFFQDLAHFAFINMAAIHAAAGMVGINNMRHIAMKRCRPPMVEILHQCQCSHQQQQRDKYNGSPVHVFSSI